MTDQNRDDDQDDGRREDSNAWSEDEGDYDRDFDFGEDAGAEELSRRRAERDEKRGINNDTGLPYFR